MDNWSKIAHFSFKRPQGPIGTPQDHNNYFFELLGYENLMLGKRVFELSPIEKSYYMPISCSGGHLGFLSKKRGGGHIVFEIERYSKSFLYMILYTCPKRHTSLTKRAYRVLFRHTSVSLEGERRV